MKVETKTNNCHNKNICEKGNDRFNNYNINANNVHGILLNPLIAESSVERTSPHILSY